MVEAEALPEGVEVTIGRAPTKHQKTLSFPMLVGETMDTEEVGVVTVVAVAGVAMTDALLSTSMSDVTPADEGAISAACLCHIYTAATVDQLQQADNLSLTDSFCLQK